MTLLPAAPPASPPMRIRTATASDEQISTPRDFWILVGLVAAVVVFAATAWMFF